MHGFVQDAALASELMAEVQLEAGNERGALTHLLAAHAGYRAWGALAKIKDLERRYPKLVA